MKLAPLVNAIFDKDAGRVLGLLQRGVDVNRVDDNGRTPLMYAAQECAPEIVELLLAAAFVRAQDAFVPGWSELTRRVSEAGEAFTIKNWPSGALVRMDLVTVR